MRKRAARKYQARKDAAARQEAGRAEQRRRTGDYRYEFGGPRKGWIRKPGKGGK